MPLDEEFLLGVWSMESIEARPQLSLTDWRIFEVKMKRKDGRTRHFVGYSPDTRAGQVSSTVMKFDNATMRGVTSSGRVYQLKGKSGWDADADHTWQTWLRINEAVDVVEVTSTFEM